MKALFEDTFNDMISQDPDLSLCDRATGNSGTAASYSRYYRNILPGNSHLLVLSYYCKAQTPDRPRGYEHIKVDENTREFIEFQRSLTPFGITGARDYRIDQAMTGEGGKDAILDLFPGYQEAISEDECRDPQFQFSTEFTAKTKDENGLKYWKFPLSCTVDSPNDHFTEVEIFQDPTHYINEGAFTYVGADALFPNDKYFIEKDLPLPPSNEDAGEAGEGEADGEQEPDQALRQESGRRQLAATGCLVILALIGNITL
jgi:hypothetical protein